MDKKYTIKKNSIQIKRYNKDTLVFAVFVKNKNICRKSFQLNALVCYNAHFLVYIYIKQIICNMSRELSDIARKKIGDACEAIIVQMNKEVKELVLSDGSKIKMCLGQSVRRKDLYQIVYEDLKGAYTYRMIEKYCRLYMSSGKSSRKRRYDKRL